MPAIPEDASPSDLHDALTPVLDVPPEWAGAASYGVFLRSPDAMLITEPVRGRLVDANPAACALLRRTVDELRSCGRDEISDPRDTERWIRAMEIRAHSGTFKGEVSFRRGDGSTFPGDVSCTTFDFGGREYAVATVRDLSERRAFEKRLTSALTEMERIASVDELTRLLNRRGFMSVGAQLVADAQRRRQPLVVLTAAVADLRDVNDALGHASGDDMLRDTAAGLTAALPDADAIARIGGDQFAVILAGPQATEAAAEAADGINEILRDQARRARRPFGLRVNIGIAIGNGSTPYALEGLLRRAQHAATRVKVGHVATFSDPVILTAMPAREAPGEIRRTLEHGWILRDRLLTNARVLQRVADDAATLLAGEAQPDRQSATDYQLEVKRWKRLADVARAFVESWAPEAPDDESLPMLTQRDRDIAALLPTQRSFTEIAAEIDADPGVVRTQTITLYRKLGAASRQEAVDRLRGLGVIDG